jgi:hypothetical protein
MQRKKGEKKSTHMLLKATPFEMSLSFNFYKNIIGSYTIKINIGRVVQQEAWSSKK